MIIPNYFFKLLLVLILIFHLLACGELPIKKRTIPERSLVVVVASFNNKKWYKRNLDSVFAQRYDNYKVIYIDDCSSDGTGDLVERYIKKKKQSHRVLLIKNNFRCGAAANRYKMYHLCDDNEVILVLDGDDWFAHLRVMEVINKVYSDNYTWVTYGQFKCYPYVRKRKCKKIVNDFRHNPWVTSHLRTFYAWLAKKVRKQDLRYKGQFFPMTSDLAEMFPILEMAGNHSRFIPKILYIYNCANILNDYKIDRKLQRQLDHVIRSRRPYSALKNLPLEIMDEV